MPRGQSATFWCCIFITIVLTRLRFDLLIAPPLRSEVSSSSSSESSAPSACQVTVQVLLHSEGLQASQQDDQMLLSQEDLFDGDKTGEKTRAVPLSELLWSGVCGSVLGRLYIEWVAHFSRNEITFKVNGKTCIDASWHTMELGVSIEALAWQALHVSSKKKKKKTPDIVARKVYAWHSSWNKWTFQVNSRIGTAYQREDRHTLVLTEDVPGCRGRLQFALSTKTHSRTVSINNAEPVALSLAWLSHYHESWLCPPQSCDMNANAWLVEQAAARRDELSTLMVWTRSVKTWASAQRNFILMHE